MRTVLKIEVVTCGGFEDISLEEAVARLRQLIVVHPDIIQATEIMVTDMNCTPAMSPVPKQARSLCAVTSLEAIRSLDRAIALRTGRDRSIPMWWRVRHEEAVAR